MPVVQEVVADPALKGDQEAEASVAQKEEAASSSSSDFSDSPVDSEPETEGAIHHRHKSAPDHPVEGRILLSGEGSLKCVLTRKISS